MIVALTSAALLAFILYKSLTQTPAAKAASPRGNTLYSDDQTYSNPSKPVVVKILNGRFYADYGTGILTEISKDTLHQAIAKWGSVSVIQQ